MIDFIERKLDQIEATRIITELERIYAHRANYTPESLNSIFYRTGKFYKKYSHKIYGAIQNNDHQEIDKSFILFAHATILLGLTLSKKGFFEQEREVLDFFCTHIPQDREIPAYIVEAFNNKSSENALRMAVIKFDEAKTDEVEYYLDLVQDFVYQRVDMAQGEKLGEIVLLQFMRGNLVRASDYLEMQYHKFEKNSYKIIQTEIQNNEALFKRSTKALEYQAFIEDFVRTKNSLTP